MKEINIRESRVTTRMGHLPISGGGLNASYTTVDAVANICTTAGNLGLKYGKDFIWAGQGYTDDNARQDIRLLPVPRPYVLVLWVGLCVLMVRGCVCTHGAWVCVY